MTPKPPVFRAPGTPERRPPDRLFLALLALAGAVWAAVNVFLVPSYMQLFAELGLALPVPTELTLQLSMFVHTHGLLLALAVVVPTVLLQVLVRDRRRLVIGYGLAGFGLLLLAMGEMLALMLVGLQLHEGF